MTDIQIDTVDNSIDPHSAVSDEKLLQCLATSQKIYVLDGYDISYRFLHETWNKICKDAFGNDPKELILLETLKFETKVPLDKVTELIEVCDTLTKRGYCIRDISKYQPCDTQCGKAIVTKELYDHAKSKWTFLPSKWSSKCSMCR